MRMDTTICTDSYQLHMQHFFADVWKAMMELLSSPIQYLQITTCTCTCRAKLHDFSLLKCTNISNDVEPNYNPFFTYIICLYTIVGNSYKDKYSKLEML